MSTPQEPPTEELPVVSSLVNDLLAGARQYRPSQVEMAMMVYRALAEEIPAVLEAPTGVGKTMAYLIPLVRSGKKAIVSTANKALQEQIFLKDIPFVQQHVAPFDAALVKGVGNYLCLERFTNESRDPRTFELYADFAHLVESVREDTSFTGDFEALPFSLPFDLRSRINGDSDLCAWSKCDFFDRCYIRRMREIAKSAQVIVVNHTLLLLDAAIDGALLPEHDAIIIDEAHHLSEEAQSAFTTTVRPTQILSLLMQRRLQAHTPQALLADVTRLSTDLWERIEQFSFGNAAKMAFREPMPEALGLAAKLVDVAATLREQRPRNQTEKEDALYDKLITRTQNLANAIRLVFAIEKPNEYVHYVERLMAPASRTPPFQACAAPLDVASFLKEKLFEKTSTIIMASATLATVGSNPARPEESGHPNFAYFRKEVGLDPATSSQVIERILPPVFDYHSHALLYLPRGLPEPVYGTGPHVERYVQAVADEMCKLVQASRGRAFLLFSSRRMLEEVYARIASRLPFPKLCQGEMNRSELTRRFRTEPGAVLFGLKSFWEGVDIAGDTLSLVVIDRLPFGVPDDPLHEARVNAMKARGENWFGEYVLPQVVLQLKQGVGRLLRTREDRGVMAILDTRLHTRGYGRSVLNALPPARRTMQFADVERFFAQR